MKKNLIPLFVALLAFQFSMGVLSKPALADDYPSQDIRWIVGGKAGGGVDLYARTVGRHMEKYLPKGVHVIVENRPGAGHSIANTMVYNAKPDGYTIGMPFMPGLYLMQILQKTEFDMTKINWVGMIDHDAQCISISSKSKYKTLDDLKKADVVRVGIVGPASEAGVLLACKSLGIKAEYVAGHKNSKEAALAAIRGDVDIVGFTYNSTRKFIAKKQIIPVIVYGSEKRLAPIPDVPTLGELGFPDLNSILGNWRSISATPGIPQDRLNHLRDVAWKAMNDPEIQAWSKEAGRPINPMTGDETKAIMAMLMKSVAEYKDFFSEFFK